MSFSMVNVAFCGKEARSAAWVSNRAARSAYGDIDTAKCVVFDGVNCHLAWQVCHFGTSEPLAIGVKRVVFKGVTCHFVWQVWCFVTISCADGDC